VGSRCPRATSPLAERQHLLTFPAGTIAAVSWFERRTEMTKLNCFNNAFLFWNGVVLTCFVLASFVVSL
jgi:hypothetical protein